MSVVVAAVAVFCVRYYLSCISPHQATIFPTSPFCEVYPANYTVNKELLKLLGPEAFFKLAKYLQVRIMGKRSTTYITSSTTELNDLALSDHPVRRPRQTQPPPPSPASDEPDPGAARSGGGTGGRAGARQSVARASVWAAGLSQALQARAQGHPSRQACQQQPDQAEARPGSSHSHPDTAADRHGAGWTLQVRISA